MKQITNAFLLVISLLFLTSCSEDDNDPVLPLGDFEKGYFVTNEGPFSNGTGTLTFIGDDGMVMQNAYKSVNGEDLGNIVQSMTMANNNAYIVVNNSNKVVVANRYTLEKITTIEGDDIQNPRYFAALGNTGYLSNWGDPFDPNDDFIAVINLITNEVISTIGVGEGPEDLLMANSNLFVNLQGGYAQNNKVAVINTVNNTLQTTITVGDVPNSLVADGTGNIWVLCGGKPEWTGVETPGSLYKINSSNFSSTSIPFETAAHPNHLLMEGQNLYYHLNGKVYKMDVKTNELPVQEIMGWDGFYYAMKAHNGQIYATDAGNFSSEGTLKVFNSSSGALLETRITGIIPGDIVFQ